MLNEPDQRERDPHPAWLIFTAILLIAAAASLLLFAQHLDRSNEIIGSPASFSTPEQRPASGQPQSRAGSIPTLITSLDVFWSTPDQLSLRGVQVALRNARVISVVGDYTFWIGNSADHRVPVVLKGELTGRQSEKQVQVRAGQVIRVFGIVRLLGGAQEIDESWAIDARDRRALDASPVFISADRVTTVTEPPQVAR
jgi:hypothetical protein